MVFTVAKIKAPVQAIGGLVVLPAYGFADSPAIDLLVLPGGFGTRKIMTDAETLDWIRKVASTANKVTSVCTGSLLLAHAGLLKARRATTHWSALELLASADASVTVEANQRYIDDGVITSAGVAAGIDMALYVVRELHGPEVAEDTRKYIEYPQTGT